MIDDEFYSCYIHSIVLSVTKVKQTLQEMIQSETWSKTRVKKLGLRSNFRQTFVSNDAYVA